MKTKTLFPALDRRKILTLGDLSRESGIPMQTLRDMIARGEIPGVFRSGNGKGRRWRIGRADAERWWEDMRRPVKI